jgi:PAS domain S-box-containing protein
MSDETLQSQIKDLLKRKMTLNRQNGQSAPSEYKTLIAALEKTAASAVQELIAERQSYQNLFKVAQEGYFVTDLQGNIREANAIGRDLLGMTQAEIVDESLPSHIHERERPNFELQMACLGELNNFHQWETVVIRKPHQEVNVAVMVSTFQDAHGNVQGLRWLMRDMTQRHEIVERLHRNTEQLIESQQIGHVGSWEWDVQRDEVTWSDEMYRIYGMEPQSVKVTFEGFLERVHDEDRSRLRMAIEKSFETHEPFSFDHRVLHPDGTIRHLHSHGIVLPDAAGKTVRMLGTGQDITEQKQAEEELHRLNYELEQRVERRTEQLSHANEQLKKIVVERAEHQESIQKLNRELDRRVAELQAILNVLPVGVTVAYDPQAAYITTNLTGQKMLGISRNENIPSNERGVIPFKVMRDGVEVPLEERPLTRAIAGNVAIQDVELDLLYEDGSILNILAYASPLYDEQDKVRGGVSAFIDITKRKVIERRLALQYTLARALAESKNVNEASHRILEIVCKEMGWELGIFWSFDEDANNLYVENLWQKPGMPENELMQASRKLFPAPGEALTGSVYLSNETLWLSDFTGQPNFLRESAARNSGFTGLVSFPIRRGEGEVLGVMEFFGSRVHPSTPDLIEMFNAFASQMGEFMGRTHVEDLRATHAQQQQVITELSQRALISDDLEEFFNEVCVRVAQTLSADFSHILELIPEEQKLVFRGAAGWPKEVIDSPVALHPDSHFMYVLSDNQPISMTDLGTETRFQIAPILLENEIVSGISVAILGRLRAFGLLEVYNTHRRNFTQDDQHFLQGVAHILAAAIQHREVEDALRFSRHQMSVILGGIADGITVIDQKRQMVYANDAAARLIGYENVEELTSTPLDQITSRFEIYDEDGVLTDMSQLPGRLALLGVVSLPKVVNFKVLKTGEERWSLVKAQPVKDEDGQVLMAVNIFHDITDLKRTELAQRLLAETSMVLATDLDHKTRLNNLAKLLVPRLGDWCAIDILDENGKLQRVGVVHVDPKMIEWAHELHKRFPPDPQAPTGAYKVVRTNQSDYYPIVPPEVIEAIPDPDRRDIARKLGLSSYMVVPLAARGHTFGVLTLVWTESKHHYSPDDLTLAEELGRRAALALDNARLYEEAQKINAELEDRVNRRTMQLQRTNARLVGEVNERKLVEEQFRRLNMELEERVAERTSQLKIANQNLQREIFERELADEALQSSLQKTRELYEISQTMGLVNTPDELLQALLASSYLASVIRASVAIFDRVWQKDDEVPPATCTILTAWNKQGKTLLYLGQEMKLVEYGLVEPYSRTEPTLIADIRHDPRVNEVMRQRLTAMDVVGSLIFPLVAAGEWYGALSLHFDQVSVLNTTNIRHLQGLVDEVAMGIYNFRILEAEAHARREAEEANKSKMKFLGMVSHELRTPLTSIKGFSTTLLAEDVEWPAETQRDFIETISSEADKLTELIEQLLNLSRLEAGAIRINPRRVEWDQVILTSLPQINALTVNHHLVIKETEPDFPILNVDIMRISQVITNLVANAVKYSPQNTTIIIATEKLSDKFIKVRVIDEGMGIPPEARNQIFEAFHQLDREKGGTQGAGLGLSICYGLIEAHGGRIWVDDDHEGPGTTMSFTLPIAEDPKT